MALAAQQTRGDEEPELVDDHGYGDDCAEEQGTLQPEHEGLEGGEVGEARAYLGSDFDGFGDSFDHETERIGGQHLDSVGCYGGFGADEICGEVVGRGYFPAIDFTGLGEVESEDCMGFAPGGVCEGEHEPPDCAGGEDK